MKLVEFINKPPRSLVTVLALFLCIAMGVVDGIVGMDADKDFAEGTLVAVYVYGYDSHAVAAGCGITIRIKDKT
jgi:hypothetical protein